MLIKDPFQSIALRRADAAGKKDTVSFAHQCVESERREGEEKKDRGKG